MKSNSQRWIIVLMVALGGMVEVANVFYDPGLQLWINRDSIEEAGGGNLYTMAFNDATPYTNSSL